MKRRESGFALISVLWTVAALALAATALLAMVRNTARLNEGDRRRAVAEAAADAALNIVALGLISGNQSENWRTDGSERDISFENFQIEVSIQDEAGKIDVNFANTDLIAGLLVTQGLSRGSAQGLASAIAARRVFLSGVSMKSDASSSIGFQSIAEVITTPGMTIDLLSKISPFITVYSQLPLIDQSVAAPEVLAADKDLSKVDIEHILSSRISNLASGSSTSAGQRSLLGHAFAIAILVKENQNPVFGEHILIRLVGADHSPYWVLRSE